MFYHSIMQKQRNVKLKKKTIYRKLKLSYVSVNTNPVRFTQVLK